jgi:hypothetical protein
VPRAVTTLILLKVIKKNIELSCRNDKY